MVKSNSFFETFKINFLVCKLHIIKYTYFKQTVRWVLLNIYYCNYYPKPRYRVFPPSPQIPLCFYYAIILSYIIILYIILLYSNTSHYILLLIICLSCASIPILWATWGQKLHLSIYTTLQHSAWHTVGDQLKVNSESCYVLTVDLSSLQVFFIITTWVNRIMIPNFQMRKVRYRKVDTCTWPHSSVTKLLLSDSTDFLLFTAFPIVFLLSPLQKSLSLLSLLMYQITPAVWTVTTLSLH